jgi:cytochrome b561
MPIAYTVLSLNHTDGSRPQVTPLQWTIAGLVIAVGTLSQVQHSGLRQGLEVWINIHLLFGLLLWGLVIARFHWGLKHSPHMLPTEVREFSRHLSRVVYLLLYFIVGVSQVVGLVHWISNGGTFDFNLFDKRFRNGPDREEFNPKDDFQLFLAYGLSALVIARVLAYSLWLRSVERAPL